MRVTTRKNLKLWIERVGEDDIISRLRKRGVGLSTIDQMLRFDYDHEPRGPNRKAIEEEMAKDGIVLDDKAS